MRVALLDAERVLLEEIADQRCKQADVALTYALAMVSNEHVDWSRVNHLIMNRWSLSGLKRVKKLAWKLLEGGA